MTERAVQSIHPRYSFDKNPLDPSLLLKLHDVSHALSPEHHGEKSVPRRARVIFMGPARTSKSIAAQILAKEHGSPLIRIDLSCVISKYLEETEKNLDKLFHSAEASNTILLFDEADALFGKRSAEKDAHDRYANSEIAYLLQKIEAFNGVAILATNLKHNFDVPFLGKPGQTPTVIEFPETPLPKRTPGVYVEETGAVLSIEGVETNIAAFIGTAMQGPLGKPQTIASYGEFQKIYGTASAAGSYLTASVRGFYENKGTTCQVLRVADTGRDDDFLAGLTILRKAALNILCAPGVASIRVQQALLAHCEELRDRFCILDPPKGANLSEVLAWKQKLSSSQGYGALYYPWVLVQGTGECVPPSGHIAGMYARIDSERGVHKAPSGTAAVLFGVTGAERAITDADQGRLDPLNVNCIRHMHGPNVLVNDARTLADDAEWKYVSVRRLMIFIEQSLDQGLHWTLFEPNDEPLWARVRLSISDFLMKLWRSGALQGSKPQEAFFVKCDRQTMTQNDLDNGRMVCLVGVAPLKPAEFVIIRIGLRTGSGQT